MPNLVSLTRPSLIVFSPDTGKSSDRVISNLQISVQSFIKENYHNSRTSHDIDMKLETVTKLDKRKHGNVKKFGDNIMSTNCDFIVFFSIYDQFAAMGKLNSGRMVYKIYIFINNNFSSHKTLNQN